jgi:hypothetical protein
MEWIAAPQGRASQCLMASMRISALSSCSRRTRAEDHPVVRPGVFVSWTTTADPAPCPRRSGAFSDSWSDRRLHNSAAIEHSFLRAPGATQHRIDVCRGSIAGF